ncbi:DoxX family protein [Gammaproteobacteria bacterium]|nr:DoxX family protein [Gammaproteobacteria bacterium]
MSNSDYKSHLDLQLSIIRIYIGIDFIHHFAEKFGLLGPQAYHDVIYYFASLGYSSKIVLLAGLCEFAAFVGFTFGLFTRIAAAGTALYLLITLFTGFHELAGFTWADHATRIMKSGSLRMIYGGWEFPLFWAVMCGSFVLTGGRKWSIDAIIRSKTNCKWLKWLAQ